MKKKHTSSLMRNVYFSDHDVFINSDHGIYFPITESTQEWTAVLLCLGYREIILNSIFCFVLHMYI